MNTQKKIHIFGASGSGVSTLGRILAESFAIPFFDADDYYWRKTNPPFQEANTPEIRLTLLKSELDSSENWVVSGSLMSWGDVLKSEFTHAIYLYVPKEERLRRIKARENARFGNRILSGGDMYEAHIKFLDWAMQYDKGLSSGRSKARHEAWMGTLECPLIKIEEVLSEKILLEKVVNRINGF